MQQAFLIASVCVDTDEMLSVHLALSVQTFIAAVHIVTCHNTSLLVLAILSLRNITSRITQLFITDNCNEARFQDPVFDAGKLDTRHVEEQLKSVFVPTTSA
ncbi:hypothetical protein BDR07DRAFT_904573 [Suillus spraguei]|nr:hypothetical protein BDR07DRAFT_904573 [Suillus spraguei]